ncbi:hypothetical protein LXA43DRAFT_1083389 [Ganoderma leucocontextum]|nr:hypothetical protein LXA43DRAFT_1083389 [Ganoderma leucocontextum]
MAPDQPSANIHTAPKNQGTLISAMRFAISTINRPWKHLSCSDATSEHVGHPVAVRNACERCCDPRTSTASGSGRARRITTSCFQSSTNHGASAHTEPHTRPQERVRHAGRMLRRCATFTRLAWTGGRGKAEGSACGEAEVVDAAGAAENAGHLREDHVEGDRFKLKDGRGPDFGGRGGSVGAGTGSRGKWKEVHEGGWGARGERGVIQGGAEDVGVG